MNDVFQHRSYRTYLKAVLAERQRHNPNYSLRAFARDLGIGAPRLSEVLSEKRNLAPSTVIRIANRLDLQPSETEYLTLLVRGEGARSRGERHVVGMQLGRYQDAPEYAELRVDAFAIIARWYHFAIVELTHTKDFRSDTRWIAQQLGITTIEADEAVRRLVHVGILRKCGDRLVRNEENVTTSMDVPSTALRQFHRDVLQKASSAVESQHVDERNLTATFFATSPEKLAEAKQRIQMFQRELVAFLEEGEQTTVYALSSQLFRVSETQARH